jgi:hypothetical protein
MYRKIKISFLVWRMEPSSCAGAVLFKMLCCRLQALLASIPPYQREARSKGVPQLGAGARFRKARSWSPILPSPITFPAPTALMWAGRNSCSEKRR